MSFDILRNRVPGSSARVALACVLLAASALQGCSNDNQPHNVCRYYVDAVHKNDKARAAGYLDVEGKAGKPVDVEKRYAKDLEIARANVKECGPLKQVEVMALERTTSDDQLRAFANFVEHYEKCDKNGRYKFIRTREGWRIY